VPIWYLRLVPALSGSLLPVAAYYLMKEFNFSRWTAAFAAAVIIMGMIYMTFFKLFVCGYEYFVQLELLLTLRYFVL